MLIRIIHYKYKTKENFPYRRVIPYRVKNVVETQAIKQSDALKLVHSTRRPVSY
jgi:predicted XRE-type DNA-binding protein